MQGATRMTPLRIGGAGIGYNGYLQIAGFLSHYLTEERPDLVCWMDFHRTAKWFRDGVDLLRTGGSDITLINMRGVCAMAMRGKGMFSEPFAGLRGLVTFAHLDWNVFAVDPAFGVRSFAELKARKCPIRLTTGYLDGDNVVGFLAMEMLRRHGIAPEDIRAWGGEIFDTGITETRLQLDRGEADAVFQEATRNDHWMKVFRRRQMVCLPMEPEVVDGLRRDFGWEMISVPADTYAHQPEPMLATDASGWLLCCREDLDEDIAWRIARIVCDHGREFPQTGMHGSPGVDFSSPQPPSFAPDIADTAPVPLHPGAARLYRERGIL